MLDGREMPEEEEELVRAQFGRIDSDGSAEVDWWEFMKFEARRYLARKSEVRLNTKVRGTASKGALGLSDI